MKKTFLTFNSVLSKSLVFLTIFMFTACKSGDPYRQKIIISGITEQYAGSDELQREFKKVTQEVLHLWDSIAVVNETIVIDTLGLHAQQTNRYIAHFSVSPVYDDHLKQVNYKYLVEIENMNTGERFQEFTTSFSPESSMFPPNKEIIRIYFTPSNFNLIFIQEMSSWDGVIYNTLNNMYKETSIKMQFIIKKISILIFGLNIIFSFILLCLFFSHSAFSSCSLHSPYFFILL